VEIDFEKFFNKLEENFKDPYPEIPGDLKLPFVGSTIEFATDLNKHLLRNVKRFGNIFKLRVLGENLVVIIGSDANKLVLHDDQDNFLSKDGWSFILGDLFKDAIMLTDGEQHTRYRRIMQSAFHKDPMKGYLKVIENEVIDYLENEIKIKNGKLLTYPAMVRLTMKIAGKLFFGLEFKGNQLDDIVLVTNASMSPLHIEIPFTDYAKGMQARRRLLKFYEKHIDAKRKDPDNDMFSQMCIAKSEKGEMFTNEEIINQMIFLMMASHDTTTSSLTSLIYETAKHPEWQNEIRNESIKFYEKGEMEYSRLKELSTFQLVFNETLRLHPPLVVLPRFALKDFDFEGYKVPANTKIVIYIYGTHIMDKYYKNPTKFNPLRFSEEIAEHKQHPYIYLPFGGGKHICIGKYFAEMESKIIMSHFVRKYKWSIPNKYVMKQIAPLNQPKDGLPIFIEKI
jgi:cytochrome P450